MSRLRTLVLSTICLAPLMMSVPLHAQDAAELLLRLDRLEGENRRLNGQVEQMGNQVRRLEDQLKRFQSDVDFRFKEVGGKPSSLPPAAPSSAPARRSDAFDPSANPSAPGTPRTIGQLAAEAGNTPPPRTTAPTGALATAGGPAPLTPGNLPPKADVSPAMPGTAKGDFDVARALLDRGDYEAAEMAFRDFLRAHARDKLKPEALFSLGESFYRRNRFREAAEQYLSVTTDHAKSGRAAEAMLKLGMSLRGLGATLEACGTYGEVGKKYPNASASIKQAVERERKRAQCAA